MTPRLLLAILLKRKSAIAWTMLTWSVNIFSFSIFISCCTHKVEMFITLLDNFSFLVYAHIFFFSIQLLRTSCQSHVKSDAMNITFFEYSPFFILVNLHFFLFFSFFYIPPRCLSLSGKILFGICLLLISDIKGLRLFAHSRIQIL